MKGNEKLLLVGVVSLAAYGLYKNYSGLVDTLSARLSSFKFNKQLWQRSGYFTLVFDVVLTVINSSSGTASIKSADLDIEVNGKKSGKINSKSTLNIYPNSEAKYPLTFRVPVLSLFGTVDSAIKIITLKQPVNVRVTGVVDATAGKLKIDESLKFAW